MFYSISKTTQQIGYLVGIFGDSASIGVEVKKRIEAAISFSVYGTET